MKKWNILFTVSFCILLAACGTGSQGTADEPTPEVTVITINDFTFSPAEISIPAGTTIQWVNEDSKPHTATSDDGIWDSGNINTNGSFSYTFDEPGTYPYFCKIHPEITGTVTVTAE